MNNGVLNTSENGYFFELVI